MATYQAPEPTPQGPPRPAGDIDWPKVLRTLVRWALVLVAIWIVGRILLAAGASLTPFILGLILAYLLLPIVKRLDQYLPRWGSILAVYMVGIILLEVVIVFVVPPAISQVNAFIENIPEWFQRANQFANQQIDRFQRSAPPEVQQQVNEQVQNVQGVVQRNASTYAQRVGTFLVGSIIGIFETISFLFGFLVIPFFLFYILNDSNKIRGAINTLLHPRAQPDFWNVWGIVDGTLGRYIRGQIILGLVIGSISFIGLQALNFFGYNIRYTVLLAIVAGIGELIPVVGPILSAIPAVLVAIGSGPSAIFAVIMLYILIQQAENQILVPRIVGNTLKLHAAILLALLVIAGAVGGLGLVIISAPLAAIGRDIFIYFHRRLSEPPLAPEQAISGLLPEDSQNTHRPQPSSGESWWQKLNPFGRKTPEAPAAQLSLEPDVVPDRETARTSDIGGKA